MNWDTKFINLCNHIASWSKDESTKVGAVIVNSRNKIVSVGYNGFPINVDDNIASRKERPAKYLWTEHAERNAIYSAAELGISLRDCRLYCNYFPCPDCVRGIIQSGIKEIIFQHQDVNSNSESWSEAKKVSKQMLIEAQIKIKQL